MQSEGLSWTTGALAGFWQQVFDYLPLFYFIRARAVCRLFRDVAANNQKHWHHWLVTYGKPEGFCFNDEDHYTRNMCQVYNAGEKCYNHQHYLKTVKIPKILKTVPLQKQVLMQVARKKLRALDAKLAKEQKTKDRLEEEIVDCRKRLTAVAHDITLATVLADKNRSKKRKTHIELNF